jgi:undecaprenyl-diphosphatase
MLRRTIQTFIWKYDKHFTTIVALLPMSAHKISVILGRMTLPSIWAITVITISLINLQLGNEEWARLGFLVVLSLPIGSLLKLMIRRARPKTIYARNMKIKSYSFPSSHAYGATVAGGYIALMSLALIASPINYVIASVCTALIVAVGISRIHVGAHYPTDVTAGWLLGCGILYILTAINS